VTSLPSPWQTTDIGTVGAAGSASYSGGTFTVAGSGADIWGTSDEFRYVHQSASGDCEIRARVATQQNTDGWAKSGVMIRESVGANSRHAMMVVTPGNGLAFQYRTATGGSSTHVAGGAGTTPYWVRLVRSGNTITASKSTNGSTWTTVGSASISMTASVRIGMAVTSHLDGTLNTSTFSNVTATP
jgi:regulation of enolase protein 1 (concanavalin A-like superfamily)